MRLTPLQIRVLVAVRDMNPHGTLGTPTPVLTRLAGQPPERSVLGVLRRLEARGLVRNTTAVYDGHRRNTQWWHTTRTGIRAVKGEPPCF